MRPPKLPIKTFFYLFQVENRIVLLDISSIFASSKTFLEQKTEIFWSADFDQGIVFSLIRI